VLKKFNYASDTQVLKKIRKKNRKWGYYILTWDTFPGKGRSKLGKKHPKKGPFLRKANGNVSQKLRVTPFEGPGQSKKKSKLVGVE